MKDTKYLEIIKAPIITEKAEALKRAEDEKEKSLAELIKAQADLDVLIEKLKKIREIAE